MNILCVRMYICIYVRVCVYVYNYNHVLEKIYVKFEMIIKSKLLFCVGDGKQTPYIIKHYVKFKLQ